MVKERNPCFRRNRWRAMRAAPGERGCGCGGETVGISHPLCSRDSAAASSLLAKPIA
jgi:hypothetical protein